MKTTMTHGQRLVLLAALALTVQAQDYSLNWFTIDGGGGTSTGGLYAVSGSVGQADAGPVMEGDSYALVGGFWGVVAAIPTPGAPLLSVMRTDTNTVLVSWPQPASGWMLEWTSALLPPPQTNAWHVIPEPYPANPLRYYILEPTPQGNRFYRLHKP